MGVLKCCVIMGAGEICDHDAVKSMIPENAFVISADGGLEHLEKMGIEPDLMVGDFDSLSGEHDLPDECIKFPSEKDETDMSIALSKAIECGYKNVLIFGGTGGRLDHTFANLSLLIFAAKNAVNARLIDEKNSAFVLLRGVHEIAYAPDCYISFFNFGNDSSVISLSGFKYELSDYTMKTDYPIGVSNEFSAEKGIVEIKQGAVLAIISKK